MWLRNGSTAEYVLWGTDSAGNFQTSTSVVSGYGYTLQSYEGYFQQDLNNDGVIGVKSAALDVWGGTKLAQLADLYLIYQGDGATGVLLRMGGMNFMAGQTGAWQPLGAEQMPNGYGVWWRNGNTDQYAMWGTDFAGNFQTSTAVVSGYGYTLQSYEGYFQQDLNSDGVIGVRSAVLETSGGTKLAQVADMYFMYQGNGATGALLRMGGMNFMAGQTGAWQPLGAEQLMDGTYQVMWKNGALDEYAVWATDSNGNYLSNTAVMSGSSATLKSYENFFQQDFNGKGGIGAGQAMMSSSGSPGDATLMGGSRRWQFGNIVADVVFHCERRWWFGNIAGELHGVHVRDAGRRRHGRCRGRAVVPSAVAGQADGLISLAAMDTAEGRPLRQCRPVTNRRSLDRSAKAAYRRVNRT